MKLHIAETLEKQSEIIKMQSDIIDHLAAALLQYGEIAEADLELMKQATTMREDIGEGV
jgi:hypothetical protein